jgi:RNA ligase (TIGR02306 family)
MCQSENKIMKLASIEEIKEILPHPNADKLEIAQVLGWQCVVKKGEFKQGDKIVFVVIDTILPSDAPWAEFLKDSKNPEKPIRLKTIKLRGQYSQGLVLPLSVLSPTVQSWHIGADVGGELGIKKYEKEVPARLAGIALGAFPTYICSQTDEENGLSNPDLVEEVLKNEWITVTQKLDGSSGTIIIENKTITHVCSRRLSLKETDENAFWKVARKLNLDKLDDGRYVIAGEVMGCGIQGNQLKLVEPEIFVFQIKYNNSFYSYQDMVDKCISTLGCKYVPHIGNFNTLTQKVNTAMLQDLADKQVLPCGDPLEGIVVRPIDYRSAGNGRPLSFKIINRNYKD